MMVIALRRIWRVAAWASVLTATVWAAIGFALGSAAADPISYSVCLALAGIAGIVNAYSRIAAPGASMALLMAVAALALGSQIGLFSPPGAAFAAIVAAAAITGALRLRLEALHLAAFGAAVLGLFVLSGQQSAAIWFTPATIWTGALFFAIAAVRVPQLGARGVALAGTGAFAPVGAITALHGARQGLIEPSSAAGAFFAVALLLAAILALTALRRGRGLAALRLALWVQMLGISTAIAAGISLALPAHLAASAFAAAALGLAVLDARAPDPVWRAFAVMAMFLAGVSALVAARTLLAEAGEWSPWFAAAAALAAPAALAGASAYVFARNGANRTAAFFEGAVLAFALAGAHVATRLAFAGGATLLHPITFVEAATHASLWLVASLILAARADFGAQSVRKNAANGLAIVALAGLAATAVLSLFSAWPAPRDSAWFTRASLGFLIPSALLWAHWVFWRGCGAANRTRVAFAAAAVSLACFLAIELAALAAAPAWAKILGAALLFSAALSANFLPGVTANGERLKLREKSPSQSATQAAL
jgi:hypothetical protein